MSTPESLIASTIRTHMVRMAVFCGLYLGVALGIAGAYLAGVAMVARAAFEAWGWIAACAAVGLCFLSTALISWLAARLFASRLSSASDRSSTAAPVPVEAHRHEPFAEAAPLHVNDPGAGDMNSIADSISRLLTDRLSSRSWIAPVAVGIATIAVVGPMRLLRIAVRAVRIARTLRMIATVVAPTSPEIGSRF